MLSTQNWRVLAFDSLFFSIQKETALLLLCLYFTFLDSKKTRFFPSFFYQSIVDIIDSVDLFRRFRITTIDFNFRSSYFNLRSSYWNRIQFSIFFDIEAFSLELFSYRASFMKNSLISITIESASIESSTKSTSILSTFAFFERTILRTLSTLTKFKSFVFFSRSNLFVFQSYNPRKSITMNFDTKFIHDDKRISNEKISSIKRTKIDKDKNRSKNDLHFTVESLRRHSTKNQAEIKTKSRITYIKTHYQRNCIVLLLIIQSVADNLDFFSASWLQNVHDVKIETITSLYRLFSFNKRNSSQKKAQRI